MDKIGRSVVVPSYTITSIHIGQFYFAPDGSRWEILAINGDICKIRRALGSAGVYLATVTRAQILAARGVSQ